MSNMKVGGQAVLEGVMMRSPHRIATAVRKPGGDIVVKKQDYIPLAKRHKILNFPIFRGTINLFEMLIIGIKALNWSAEVAIDEIASNENTQEETQDEESNEPRVIEDTSREEGKKKSGGTGFSIFIALVIGLGMGMLLFFFIPITLTSLMGLSKGAFTFNIVAGALRMIIFLIYLFVISRLKDIRRVFEYHGAEHKSVFAFENGEELTVENTRAYSTHHPRCGTTFILIVALIAILVFAATDTLFAKIFGHAPNILQRFGWHLLFLPIVAGISYEWLKIGGKGFEKDSKVLKVLSAPGLWLQNITTIEPSSDQIEVALVALKEAIK
ncbi:DUF1385 domain-containing protein [bacterium]|nr:DUF1385 domain-containing protein [bacterium]